MSTHDGHRPTPDLSKPPDSHGAHGNHGGHGWMMLACCIPMILIAVALVATGVVGVGWLLVAFTCVALMALIMRATSGGDGGHH
ncbi:hypothetical protein SMIR_40995 (plasmid) [Streptomyces mirabilis]|uniref:hypothetical protein n=1 Tax=Streptomyces mirabilis TaxID=68239 RepID=UPI001BB02455|nr:hypothetical protein [Streptomyces mirabilis]QUW85877.1 hypothetical protein SMIR_40995 [Streptomyces mirabilis]